MHAADVEAALRAGAGALLESVRLFDVYTGEQVGAGKKSLAFALRFRAPDRTLTEAEIRAAVDAARSPRPQTRPAPPNAPSSTRLPQGARSHSLRSNVIRPEYDVVRFDAPMPCPSTVPRVRVTPYDSW